MKITIHTERGTFQGKEYNATDEEIAAMKRYTAMAAASKLEHFTLDTPTGVIIIGDELLKTAVFVVDL